MSAPAAPKLLTADDLLKLAGRGRYELTQGELIEISPPGAEHGRIAFNLGLLLGQHVKRHKLGQMYAAETGFCLARDPDTVRAPDVAFVAAERLPAQAPKGYLDLAPDLVAEVVSPTDDPDAVQAKIAEWLAAGARAVLVVFPGPRQVAVYLSLKQVVVLTEADTLELPELLPGFACPVAELFA